MKRLNTIILAMAVAALIFVPPASGRLNEKETAEVQFYDRTDVAGVILEKGKYLFEHDDERMARGEPCMYVYTLAEGKPDKLAVSFHCQPVERKVAASTVTTEEITKEPGVFRLKEVQFAGSRKGHIVPVQETAPKP
ncbi:MAG: hypothetical protein AB1631_01035 [Acidobacteriota bacterium]